MWTLTEAQKKTHADLIEAIREADKEFYEASVTYQDAAEEYNDAISEAERFSEDIAYEMRKYYDSQSQEWRDSKEGQEFDLKRSMWANVNIEKANDINELCIDEELEELEALPTLKVEIEDEQDAA